MRQPSPILLSVAVVVGGLTAATSAAAQVDVNPPLPNALLLIDSSGSMERKSSDGLHPVCDPGNSGGTNEKSRWIELVEVLTGTTTDYSCYDQSRKTSAFNSEYTIGTTSPYDYNYKYPFNRMVSGDCVYGPGALPTPSRYDFPASALITHRYDDPSNTGCSFNQSNDGLLDSFRTQARFALMTFDTRLNDGRGSPLDSDAAGVAGTWSYYVGSPAVGNPALCDSPHTHEVGARNAAAPPWEGRMVGFGDPFASTAALINRNAMIQNVLLSSRSFGATPIAGMLEDARDFLMNDATDEQMTGATWKFGPKDDPFVAGGCRENFIILLTDGAPNLDVRPECEPAGVPSGICPYEKPETVALDLASNGIPTYVVGFALSNVTVGATPIDCTALTAADIDDNPASGSICALNPNNLDLQACCAVNRISYAGNGGPAEFATNATDLKIALANAFPSAPVTSRTLPVSANPSSAAAGSLAAGFRFTSGLRPNGARLSGSILNRQRFECKLIAGVLEPEPQTIDAGQGDKFIDNVNSGAGNPRRFVSVLSSTAGVDSTESIRPNIAGVDGLGNDSGIQYDGTAAAFVAATDPAAMDITGATCVSPAATATACRDRIMGWTVGIPTLGTIEDRCVTPGTAACSLIGSIERSTPTVVGRPNEFLRDEAYQRFIADNTTRPLMLYTSSNDGFLHAFKVAANDATDTLKVDALANNELWAFAPPAVLPSMVAQFPGIQQKLLDGLVRAKDVVATNSGGTLKFERDQATARAASGTWRTVVLAGFGSERGGYYALDVTEPELGPGTGPKFLWQLTTDDAGNPLFGTGGATPAIATVFLDIGGSKKEVAVAILPGGTGGTRTATLCPRTDLDAVDTNFTPRTNVFCYSGTDLESRSLTIVRLDSGEIIRTFRPDTTPASVPPGVVAQARVTVVADMHAPITGQPAAFPSDTGTVADRAFVGDADGNMWRVDLSSSNAANWSMEIFFDSYPSSLGFTAADGQPIVNPPILSSDEAGNITVALSTGDQENISSVPGMRNFVWSLTEVPDTSGGSPIFESSANWYTRFDDGERLTGPMTLFLRRLFFSVFAPATGSNVCDTGTTRVFGMDFIEPASSVDPSQGGLAAIPDSGGVLQQFLTEADFGTGDDATIFGVSVAQVPTCSEEDTSFSDPYLGGGTHTSLTNVNPGTFELVFHTGSKGATAPGGEVNEASVQLQTPEATAIFDSWAAILE